MRISGRLVHWLRSHPAVGYALVVAGTAWGFHDARIAREKAADVAAARVADAKGSAAAKVAELKKQVDDQAAADHRARILACESENRANAALRQVLQLAARSAPAHALDPYFALVPTLDCTKSDGAAIAAPPPPPAVAPTPARRPSQRRSRTPRRSATTSSSTSTTTRPRPPAKSPPSTLCLPIPGLCVPLTMPTATTVARVNAATHHQRDGP